MNENKLCRLQQQQKVNREKNLEAGYENECVRLASAGALKRAVSNNSRRAI